MKKHLDEVYEGEIAPRYSLVASREAIFPGTQGKVHKSSGDENRRSRQIVTSSLRIRRLLSTKETNRSAAAIREGNYENNRNKQDDNNGRSLTCNGSDLYRAKSIPS